MIQVSQIIGNSIVCSSICQANNKENKCFTLLDLLRGIHQFYWHFLRGINQWLMDSPHKGPVMQKVYPCHDVIINVPCTALALALFFNRVRWRLSTIFLSDTPPNGRSEDMRNITVDICSQKSLLNRVQVNSKISPPTPGTEWNSKPNPNSRYCISNPIPHVPQNPPMIEASLFSPFLGTKVFQVQCWYFL